MSFFPTCGLGIPWANMIREFFPNLSTTRAFIARHLSQEDDVEVIFAGAPDADLKATMSSFGGVTISGRYTFRGEELHIAMGGLLFENSQLSITELEGHAYMGIDVNGDGSIDCGIMGDFNAKKSS